MDVSQDTFQYVTDRHSESLADAAAAQQRITAATAEIAAATADLARFNGRAAALEALLSEMTVV